MAPSKETLVKRPDETWKQALQIISMSIVPMTLKSALELGLLDIIFKAGDGAFLSASQVAGQIHGLKNPDASASLDRMMGLLANFSLLERKLVDGKRAYGITPLGKYFLMTESSGDKMINGSFGELFLSLVDEVFMKSWNQLSNAVLDGGVAFNRAHGMPFFEYMSTDPRFNSVYNKSMSGSSELIMNNILNVYDGFQGIKVLIDVGGGTGQNLNLIMSRNPTITKGINYDLPHVVANALAYPGIEHIGGDMFDGIPNGDAIFMKWILHDWSDEDCLKLLHLCWKALPNSGKVIVVEWILETTMSNDPEFQIAYVFDLHMMAQTSGGKERTTQEFKELAISSGFSKFEVVCSAVSLRVMELHK